MRVQSGSCVYCLCSTERDAGRFMPCSLAKLVLDRRYHSDKAAQQYVDKTEIGKHAENGDFLWQSLQHAESHHPVCLSVIRDKH